MNCLGIHSEDIFTIECRTLQIGKGQKNMAIMVDPNLSEYEGERLVWNSLNENFPDSAVVYFNREVEGRIYDYCVLLENMGILVIEVKGWLPDGIKVIGPDEIWVKGYSDPQHSPLKQARTYQYRIKKQIEEACDLSVLAFSMVCYPFISAEEFRKLRLDLISSEQMTLLKEDLEDRTQMEKKIYRTYKNVEASVYKDYMTPETRDRIRQYYEPEYRSVFESKSEEKVLQLKVKNCYSKLHILREKSDESLLQLIVDEYGKGVKETVFLSDSEDFTKLADLVRSLYKAKGIVPDRLNLKVGKEEFSKLDPARTVFRYFNFEAFLVPDLTQIAFTDLTVIEGKLDVQTDKILQKLAEITDFNIEQYKIEHADPKANILVKAGAGTGKTYSMVSRIAFLSKKSQDPVTNIQDEIAMLTFTNEAVGNMKRRISKMYTNYFILTGDLQNLSFTDQVERMQISTIHKFAINILQKQALSVGLSSAFTLSQNSLVRKQFYLQAFNAYLQKENSVDSTFIDSFPVPLYKLQSVLMEFANKAMEKGIDLTTITEGELGNPRESEINHFNDMIIEVVKPAEQNYLDYQKEHNFLTLSQCLIELRRLLKTNPKAVEALKYRYLFIDEFQDTDNSQIQIFKALQRALTPRCHLFVVGDLKQSIYRFRGATISAFDQLLDNPVEKWADYSLRQNYRTDKDLLDSYHQWFIRWGANDLLSYQQNQDRLTSSVQYKQDRKLNSVDYYRSTEIYDLLAECLQTQVTELQARKDFSEMSKEEKTIAILVRNNYEALQIEQKMKEKGLVVETANSKDLYEQPSTIDFYKLIQALLNPRNPVYLASLIQSNYIGMQPGFENLKGLSDEAKTTQLMKILSRYFRAQTNRSFTEFLDSVYQHPVLFVLKEIYEGLKPWKRHSKDKNRQIEYLNNLELLIEMIASSQAIDSLTLNDIKRFLDIRIKAGTREAISKSQQESSGIRMIVQTVHKSKGMEFGTVILPHTDFDFGREREGTQVDWTRNGLAYQVLVRASKNDKKMLRVQNTNFDAMIEQNEVNQEETRLLYVALTRAIYQCIYFYPVRTSNALSWAQLMEN